MAGADADAVSGKLAAYYERIGTFEEQDVAAAVDRFLRGAVPDQNLKFPPTPVQLGAECAAIRDKRMAPLYAQQRAQRELEEQRANEAKFTPEYRARMAERLSQLAQKVASTVPVEDAPAPRPIIGAEIDERPAAVRLGLMTQDEFNRRQSAAQSGGKS